MHCEYELFNETSLTSEMGKQIFAPLSPNSRFNSSFPYLSNQVSCFDNSSEYPELFVAHRCGDEFLVVCGFARTGHGARRWVSHFRGWSWNRASHPSLRQFVCWCEVSHGPLRLLGWRAFYARNDQLVFVSVDGIHFVGRERKRWPKFHFRLWMPQMERSGSISGSRNSRDSLQSGQCLFSNAISRLGHLLSWSWMLLDGRRASTSGLYWKF